VEEFARTAERIWQQARQEGRLLQDPSREELVSLMEKEPEVRKTKYGSFVAESEPTSRSAMFTRNSVDHPFGEEERALLEKCERILAGERLVCVDVTVGSPGNDTIARLIVPQRYAHVAYGGRNLYAPAPRKEREPDYTIIFFTDEAFEQNKSKPLPQKDITIRLAMFDDGRMVKIVRNSNYIGEFKKGVFAGEDWNAKVKKGGLFLHAGCREDYLQSPSGDYKDTKTLIVALSANGKTTLTGRIIAKKGKEKSWLVQDDGGTLMPDGSFRGFEAGAVYVKTEDVNPGEQREIYYGLLKPGTMLENVYVEADGDLDFYNLERTSNGRAVVLRGDLMHAKPSIDVEEIDNLILITRGNIIPAISKLTREQAVALMVVGQAMESSAGDPTQAGKIRSEFFYDPFVAGDRAAHANRLYEILQGLPRVNFFLLNTGGIGEGRTYRDITVDITMEILDSLLRGGLDDAESWVDSPTGFKVPKAVRHVDDIYFHPEKQFSHSEFESRQRDLERVRLEAIEKIGDSLYPEIRNAL